MVPTRRGLGRASYYVEVRTCYKFETLFNLDVSLPMNTGLDLGDISIERHQNVFVVDCPVRIQTD